jgi:protein-disulfide isomerase
MKKNFDKLLVLTTFSIFFSIFIALFWIDLAHPKKIDLKNGLVFGNTNSLINLVVFEDFKCKSCKKFSHEIFPQIKDKYLDTNKISYKVVPLAIIYGSKTVANAAIIIYEMNKKAFFDFIKIISDEAINIETKEDLVNIVKTIQGINIEVFKEFLVKGIFDNSLQDNLNYAKKIIKPFQVPAIYLNGNPIKINEINNKVDELIYYWEKNK